MLVLNVNYYGSFQKCRLVVSHLNYEPSETFHCRQFATANKTMAKGNVLPFHASLSYGTCDVLQCVFPLFMQYRTPDLSDFSLEYILFGSQRFGVQSAFDFIELFLEFPRVLSYKIGLLLTIFFNTYFWPDGSAESDFTFGYFSRYFS